jgi:hypothetical protein
VGRAYYGPVTKTVELLAASFVEKRSQPAEKVRIAAVGSLEALEFLEELDGVFAGEPAGWSRRSMAIDRRSRSRSWPT